MRVAIIAVALVLLALQQRDKHPQPAQQVTAADQRGTENTPLVVKIPPAQKTDKETSQEQQWRKDQSDANWWMVRLTLAYGIVALLQLGVFGLQARRLRQTIIKMEEIAKGQAGDMRDSIKQATRSATAMEKVAHDMSISANAAKDSVSALSQQMRAYITVVIGTAIYQERSKGLKFEGKPTMLNTGLTPARKVRHRVRAAILPVKLPEDFDFALPSTAKGASVVGSHQPVIMSAIVDNFIPDQDVDAVKFGSGDSVLYCWGSVTYEDVFGESHETKFCQILTWLRDEKQTVYGYYIDRHNDAT